MIEFHTDDVPMPILEERLLKRWIKDVARQYGKETGDLHYIFCSDQRITEVNISFLNHTYATDIITFDYGLADQISGDLYIGLETVYSNAMERTLSKNEELLRVLIHGVLHLCGFGDKTEEAAALMRKREDNALNLLHLMKQE
ncbi:MAG: rRNA maturation RNase YbeY [Bacteroidales bacterium]|jgi:rRNA maturation RNase YbeY|nr:rRNA maturation RNase YbeY [Bacteroidales bacterium]MDD3166026.1 rRNA maturation RNase YbeY [Bacteroidales bacterium]MDD4770795.1 rRNA maturation RNase YbeY [Bacteroidales bacterium]HKL92012.1 rRNA maturation RNase YbeY [Bacteroidales bacterium]